MRKLKCWQKALISHLALVVGGWGVGIVTIWALNMPIPWSVHIPLFAFAVIFIIIFDWKMFRG